MHQPEKPVGWVVAHQTNEYPDQWLYLKAFERNEYERAKAEFEKRTEDPNNVLVVLCRNLYSDLYENHWRLVRDLRPKNGIQAGAAISQIINSFSSDYF